MPNGELSTITALPAEVRATRVAPAAAQGRQRRSVDVVVSSPMQFESLGRPTRRNVHASRNAAIPHRSNTAPGLNARFRSRRS
jgi:hypothetical protein